MSEILPRDLQPGMKIVRLGPDVEPVEVEIGEVVKISKGKYIGYRVVPKEYIGHENEVMSTPEKSHLMPFIAPARYRLELAD